jgi:hypothetical protein
MRVAFGGTFLTLGCLTLIGALFAAGWATVGPDADLPGRGGLPAFLAFGLGGWTCLLLFVGGLLLKKEPRSALRLSPLFAAILGTLLGCGAYLLYELQLGGKGVSAGARDDEEVLRLRGFGTVFEFSGGRSVRTANERGYSRPFVSEGGIAKWFLYGIGVCWAYGLVGGLGLGGLAAMAIRRGLPDQAADYADKLPPPVIDGQERNARDE